MCFIIRTILDYSIPFWNVVDEIIKSFMWSLMNLWNQNSCHNCDKPTSALQMWRRHHSVGLNRYYRSALLSILSTATSVTVYVHIKTYKLQKNSYRCICIALVCRMWSLDKCPCWNSIYECVYLLNTLRTLMCRYIHV